MSSPSFPGRASTPTIRLAHPIRRRAFLTAVVATSAAAGLSVALAGEARAASIALASSAPPLLTHEQPAGASRSTALPPTIVLVHGAFAESSSWNGVAAQLLTRGYPVVAVANPLRGLKHDADYVASALAGVQGPIVLVGHSYGGSVISNAANGNPNVAALVYVAGFAPEAGESAVDLSGLFPGSTLGAALAPPVTLPDDNLDLYITLDKFRAQFAADVPEAEARLMATTQRPVTEAALKEGAGSPAWRTIPSWFVYGTLDLNIPAAAMAFMAERANARGAVAVEGASHVVMISQPEAVAQVIIEAATA